MRLTKSNATSTLSGGSTAIGNSGSGPASFQDFQDSIDDAWDSGDDEFCTVSDVKISKRVSKSAALNVINSHRSNSGILESQRDAKDSHRVQKIIPEEKKAEALQRLAVQPLHLRNANLAASLSPRVQNSDELEGKCGVSPYHKPLTQFPGRPQPLKPSTAPAKFFIPSKEHGTLLINKKNSKEFILNYHLKNFALFLQMAKAR